MSYFERIPDKDKLTFLNESVANVLSASRQRGDVIAFADTNHLEKGVRNAAFFISNLLSIKKVGIEWPKDASFISKAVYNGEFKYPRGLKPVAIDVPTSKRKLMNQHPSLRQAYGAINTDEYLHYLQVSGLSPSESSCEFNKYRLSESDVEVSKNVMTEDLGALVFGANHFDYKLNGEPAGIDNFIERLGRNVTTVAVVAANRIDVVTLEQGLGKKGPWLFEGGDADINYTYIIPAQRDYPDYRMGDLYEIYHKGEAKVNFPYPGSIKHPECRGVVPDRVVDLKQPPQYQNASGKSTSMVISNNRI